jgi:hypothetical protein
MRAPLTRADLLRRATAILGQGWAEEVEDAMNIINVDAGSAAPPPKRDPVKARAPKLALLTYRNALRNLIDARKRLFRDADQFSWVFALTQAKTVTEWQTLLDARVAKQPVADDFDRVLAGHLATADKLIKKPPRATKFDDRARAAVREAAELLLRAGKPCVTKRKSEWWRLSAILYGDPHHDLYHVIREYRRAPPAGDLYAVVVGPGKIRRPNRNKK